MENERLSRNHDFRRLWIGGVVSVLGSAISSLTYPLLALSVAESTAQAGLVGLLGLGIGAATRLPAGVLVDRVPVRLALVSSDVVRVLTTVSVLAVVLSGRLALWELAAAAALNAAASAVHDVARSVALRRIVAADQLSQAFALDEGRNHVTGLLGQPAGGLLYGVAPALPLAADLLSFTTSAGLSARISDPLRLAPGPRGNARADLVTGLVFVWRQPLLRTTLLAAAGFQLVFAAAVFALIATLKATGTSPASLGLLFGVAGCGGVAGALATTRLQRRFSLHVLVTSMGTVATVVFALLTQVHQPLVVGLLLGSIFFLSAPANAVLLAAQASCTPMPLQGRAMSASYLIAGLVAPLAKGACGRPGRPGGRPRSRCPVVERPAGSVQRTHYHLRPAGCWYRLKSGQPGSAVFIASMSGSIVNVPQWAASYNASKAAVAHLGRSLAIEWATAGIRVNSIFPGYVLTDLTQKIIDKQPELLDSWVAQTPQGRMAMPADLSRLVSFLASDASAYLTVQDVVIDGGYTAV